MNIKYSKETIKYVDHLVNCYCRYDSFNKNHYVLIDDISFRDLSKLASLIMLDDKDYAVECLSVDNPFYEENVHPAIINWLNGSKHNQEIRTNVAKAVVSYQKNRMIELLEDRVFEFNQKDVA